MGGALANRPFVKMNGIGNEIVVVDMRAGAEMILAEEARAAVNRRFSDIVPVIGVLRDRTAKTRVRRQDEAVRELGRACQNRAVVTDN